MKPEILQFPACVLSHKYTIESLVLPREARMNNQLFASLVRMRRSLPTQL